MRARAAFAHCLGRVTRWDAIVPGARFCASPVRPRGRGAHAKRPRRRPELPDCHRERAHRWQTPRLATGQRASALPAAWLASALPSASASTRPLGRRSRSSSAASVRQLNSWTSAWTGESRSALLVCGMTAAVTGCVERDSPRRRASGCCWRAKAGARGIAAFWPGVRARLAAQSARRAGDRVMTRPLRAGTRRAGHLSIRPDHPLRCTHTAVCPSEHR
jgi:hypothetical protein